jgi:hypothetical protein
MTGGNSMTDKSGKLAYEAYARAKDLDTRDWAELPEEQQWAWSMVADEADRQANQAGVAELLDTEASRPTEAEGPTPSEDDYVDDESTEDVIGNH